MIAFFIVFNVIFNPIIVSLKQDKLMAKMYFFVGVTFLLYGSVLTCFYSYKGMLYSMLIVELSIFLLSVIAMKKGLQRNMNR